MSPPVRCPYDPVWERFCDFCSPNVACFVLPASPFQWSWHCCGAHVLYCWPYSFLSWTDSVAKPLCMRSCVQTRLYYLSADSRSLESVVQSCEEMKMPFIFAPFSAPYWDFGGRLKPCVCVWQCHRREGGAEDLCTSLLLNCLRCKREKKKTELTLHCTKICVRFLSYFYRGETVEIHCCSVHTCEYLFCIHIDMNCFFYIRMKLAELLAWVYIVVWV